METTRSETALRYIEPSQLRVFRTEDGQVRATIGEECSLFAPRFLRVLPLSDPDRYISMRGPEPNGKEVALLRNWKRLDREPRELVQAELDRRYLHAVVKSVLSLRNVFGVAIVELETDRGVREATFRDISDNVIRLGESRLLITDAEGNRYDIPDLGRLDRRSRALLASLL